MSREYTIGGPLYAGYVSDAGGRDFALPFGLLAGEPLPTPPVEGEGLFKVWMGSAWVGKPIKYWSGSAWVTKPLKRWNGSAWVPTAGGAAPPAVPPIMSTAAIWLDATQAPFTDGQSMTNYTEHSDNHRVLTSTGDDPVFRANIGGKPMFEFSGAKAMNTAVDFQPPTTGLTFVLVSRSITFASYGMMLVYNSTGGGADYEMRHYGPQTQVICEYWSGGPSIMSSLSETLGVDYLRWVEWDTVAPTAKVWMNGTETASAAMLTTMTRPVERIWVGRRSDGYASDCYIAEALVFGGPVASADRIAVTNYLMTKWTLT